MIDLTAITDDDTLDGIIDFTEDAEDFGSLEAAINGAIAQLGADETAFFNWVDGNTYIVVDGETFTNGTNSNLNDVVIRLIGTYEFADTDLENQIITIS